MKTQVLKSLIDFELDQMREKLHKLIDMHTEAQSDSTPAPVFHTNGKVPYYTICSCNPENGGSGICGCTVGNTMVDPTWPRTYTSTSTTTTNEN